MPISLRRGLTSLHFVRRVSRGASPGWSGSKDALLGQGLPPEGDEDPLNHHRGGP